MSASLELDFSPEDRYSRLRLISWWDQKLLAASRVLVVGAGALGNEIIKNLALLGVGNIYIVDMDRIEAANLSRSVLFRAEDEGQFKAEVAAGRAREINPDINAVPLVGNVVSDVGMGLFRHVDLVIGGLDNREARVAINQKCWLTDRPWVDGAIEVLHGIARVFVPPQGPCYECTMTAEDYRLLNQRRSCALLNRDELLAGKVPTTPTSASVIAGVQVQEAVKLLHRSSELPLLAGKGFVFDGRNHDSYVVEYQEKEGCLAHETIPGLVVLDQMRSATTTAGEMLNVVRREMAAGAILELNQDVVTDLACPGCGEHRQVFRVLQGVSEGEARCPSCSRVMVPEMTHRLAGDEAFLDWTLKSIGIPPWDIMAGRNGWERVFFELAGDRAEVLGETSSPGDELDHEQQ